MKKNIYLKCNQMVMSITSNIMMMQNKNNKKAIETKIKMDHTVQVDTQLFD